MLSNPEDPGDPRGFLCVATALPKAAARWVTDAVSGSVEGDYVVNGTRTHFVGGRLDLASTPKTCITIPNWLGAFCREF
jgi:hypothetical protein